MNQRQNVPFSVLRSCCAFLLLVLAGCASQVNMLPTLSTETQLAANEGLVVARVVNAGGASLPFNQLTINADDVQASKENKPDRLLALEPYHGNSTVFSSPVKQGNYSVGSVRLFHTVGDGWYSNFVNADIKLGTFEVKPGQVTDLGTIIYYPRFQDGRYVQTLIRAPQEAPGTVLNTHFSHFAFDQAQVLGWKDDGLDEDRHSSYVSAVQNPVAYAESFKAPDGSLYFLSRLGVLIIRTPDGEWDMDALDTNLHLSSIDISEAGDVLVGGTEGVLFYKKAGGEWVDLSLREPDNVHRARFKDDGGVELLVYSPSSVRILRGDALNKNVRWQELNRFDTMAWQDQFALPEPKTPPKRKPIPRRVNGVDLAEFDGKHYVTVATASQSDTRFFANTRNTTFRYDPESWFIEAKEELPDMSNVLDAGAARIGIKRPGFWSWSGKTRYYRYDQSSADWQEMSTSLYYCGDQEVPPGTSCESGVKRKTKSFSLIAVPWFKNDQEAIAISSFSDYSFWSGQRSYETKLLASSDGGKSWTMTDKSLPEKYCNTLVPEVVDRMLVSCNGASGDFYESIDDGATWEHVREHQNF